MKKNISGIIDECLIIDKGNKKKATHFALCNGGKIRYLIDLSFCGKMKLSKNISSYSLKLRLLMCFLPILSFYCLKVARLGYFVTVNLHSDIDSILKQQKKERWNAIIGTYDEKQKIVFQGFNSTEPAIFIKVGNKCTVSEMAQEMSFLCKAPSLKNFEIPEIISKVTLDENGKFSIQVTKEFHGKKVKPGVTNDVYAIWKEIASISDDGENSFSHGDFTPWNLKKKKNGFVVYDWEHCGLRISGFDLMHYAIMPRLKLNNQNFDTAFDAALAEIREIDPMFDINKKLFKRELDRLRLE